MIMKEMTPKVTINQNRDILRAFMRMRVDIVEALNNIFSSKAMSYDGVHAMFYQKFFDIVSEETIQVCLKV